MKVVLKVLTVLAGLHLAMSALSANANGPTKGPILKPDARYEERTAIAKSAIPGSGNGLFAKVKFKAGDVIGELGGELVDEPDMLNPSAYLAGLPDCAFTQISPYRYIDSKDHGGHVSRINFAPSLINGKETGFQNSRIERICTSPWVIFVATRDIEPGEEMFASYGPDYGYGRFMNQPHIRDYFCGLAKVDCSQKWDWEP